MFGKEKGKEKGGGSHLCKAPEGPLRQMTPAPFFLAFFLHDLGNTTRVWSGRLS
jgi:hypothetical protein